jgi:hypothetical protein
LITLAPTWKSVSTSLVGMKGWKSGIVPTDATGGGAGAGVVAGFVAVVGERWSRRAVAVFPIARWRLSTRASV